MHGSDCRGDASIRREAPEYYSRRQLKLMPPYRLPFHSDPDCYKSSQAGNRHDVRDTSARADSLFSQRICMHENDSDDTNHLHLLADAQSRPTGDDGDAISTEEGIFDLTININVKGVFFGCKYGIPALKRAGG